MDAARAQRQTELWRLAAVALVAVATAGAAFNDGAFFAGTTALLAIGTGLFAALWLIAAPDAIAGLTRTGLAGAAALALLTAYDLASALWSDSPARATLEYDRTLLYALAFGLFACIPDGRRTLRLLVPAVALALGVAVVAGVLGRIAPDLVDVTAARADDRLSWPFGYWNALGIAGSLTALMATAVVVDPDRRPVVRAAFAALVPWAAVGTYLSLSRGGIAGGIAGALVLLAMHGRAALAAAVAAALPAGGAVLVAAREQDLVSGGLPADRLADAGRPALTALAIATVAAVALAFAAARLTRGIRPRRPWPTRTRAAVALAALTAVVAVGLTAGADDARRAWREGTRLQPPPPPADVRDRLVSINNQGRVDHWRVAWRTFEDHPWTGTGGGTYEVNWDERRRLIFDVHDAHSLYLETLADRGIAGSTLLLVALGAGLAGLTRRGRSPAATGLAAAVVALLAHAGIDWDWEMPALMLWLFAALGAATAAATPRARTTLGSATRLVGALAALFLLFTPYAIARSQAHLRTALDAFRAGDCVTATDAALSSAEAASWRPEPFELLAYCRVRTGQDALARSAIAGAIRRDPSNWELRYAAALVDGATGEDPLPQLARARELNPREPRVLAAQQALAKARTPRQRERVARRLPLVIPAARP